MEAMTLTSYNVDIIDITNTPSQQPRTETRKQRQRRLSRYPALEPEDSEQHGLEHSFHSRSQSRKYQKDDQTNGVYSEVEETNGVEGQIRVGSILQGVNLEREYTFAKVSNVLFSRNQLCIQISIKYYVWHTLEP
jgi:hypothetical protein